jgi:hypothetical protein
VTAPFVPDDFAPPLKLVAPPFVLEPLGPQHNERDHVAWMSSIAHIRATPGFTEPDPDDPWPRPLTLARNLQDLEGHAADFAARRAFTYSVLDPVDDDVIGCLYLDPSTDGGHDVRASSWVRASRSDLDVTLWEVVSDWLATAWPFTNPDYDARSRT